MEYESSPTIKFEGEGATSNEDSQSEKTASEGSDGFIKVDQVLEEDALKTPVAEEPPSVKPDVENIPSVKPPTETTNKLESALYGSLDPKDDDLASEKTLRDYYEQLPTETAPFSVLELSSEEANPREEKQPSSDAVESPSDQWGGPKANGAADLGSLPTPFEPESPSSTSRDSEQDLPEVPMEASQNEEKSEADLLGPDTPSEPEHAGIEELGQDPPLDEGLPEEVLPPVDDAVKDEALTNADSNGTGEPIPEEEPPTAEASSKRCDISSYLQSRAPGGANEREAKLRGGKDPVIDLLFWRDVKLSAFVSSMSLLILLSLRFFSVLTVVAYLALSLLTVTVSIRLYKFVLQTLNGSQQPNPFQQLLDADIALSQEQVNKYVESLLRRINDVVSSTRDLLLVRSTVASIKFGLLMWMMTYVGGCMNGLTILTVVALLSFTVPPFYERYQEPIDANYTKVSGKIGDLVNTVKSKVPGSKPKTQ